MQNETITELLTVTTNWEGEEQNCVEFPCWSTPNIGTTKTIPPRKLVPFLQAVMLSMLLESIILMPCLTS